MKQGYTIPRGALDGVEAFLRVAERASFRAAADDLGISPSAVSQAVRALERRLGVALFTRTTRTVGLTEAGAAFLAGVRPAFAAILEASGAANDLGREPSGLLRLTASRPVVSLILQPMLASFCEAFPKVTLEIETSEELVDLAAEGFDAGLRLGEAIAADMVAVRLSPPFRFVLVASPTYLYRRGRPEQPRDLMAHACIRIRRAAGLLTSWHLRGNAEPIDMAVTGPLIVSDLQEARDAALHHVGIAQLPEPFVERAIRDGQLEEVLPSYAPSSDGIFIFFPSRAQVMPKLRAFIDHARSHLPWLTPSASAPLGSIAS